MKSSQAPLCERPFVWVPIGSGVVSDLDLLPDPTENLFGRLIRNPQPKHRPPKERECAEMLASVLTLAPTVRGFVLERWLDGEVGAQELSELLFEIQTEGASESTASNAPAPSLITAPPNCSKP